MLSTYLRFLLLACLLVSCSFSTLVAQAHPGWALDPYAGISAAFLQPAATAAIPYNWDLHLGGAALHLQNNSFFIRNASLTGLARDLAGGTGIGLDETELAFRVNGRNYAYDFTTHDHPVFVHTSAEITGPAFSVQVGNYTRIGNFSRIRTIASTRRTDPVFNYYNLIGADGSAPFQLDPLYAAAVGWAEFGGHLSRAFSVTDDAELRLGLNVKFLLPVEGASFYNPDGSSALREDSLSRTFIDGDTDIALTNGDGSGPAGRGLGADLGVQYAWGSIRGVSGYRYTVGASVLDVGNIVFNQRSRAFNFNNDGLVRLEGPLYDSTLTAGGIDAALEQLSRDFYDGNATAARRGSVFRVGLPTMVSLQLSARPTAHVFVSAAYTGDLPLRKQQLSRGQQLVVSGHYSRWWYGAGLSAGMYDWREFNIGMQLRAGPLYLGTNRLFGTLFGTGELAAADFYFGLRIHEFNKKKGRKGKSRNGGGRKGKTVKCYDF